MSEDQEKEDTIKLGKDLKIGDCIRAKHGSHTSGIIKSINELEDFYEDKLHYEIYDINYFMNGPCSTHLDLKEEFTVINSRKEILRYYNIVELGILGHAADLMDFRRDLKIIKSISINRINKKLAKKAKKNKENK